MSKRIVLIGAGSALFTRGILGSLVTDKRFAGYTLVLMDIDPGILSVMESYAGRLVGDTRSPLKIEAETRLARAVEGADYVITTLAANDSRARGLELEVPLSFGYHHSWGDTTGPSGVFRGLRHIPIFLDIAREMERSCPEAWLINITDPMAVLCRAVFLETRTKMIGLCDGPPYFRIIIEQEILELPAGSLKVKMAGVDHQVWVLEMSREGEDQYPEFRRKIDRLEKRFSVNKELFLSYGYFPIPGNEHISEFFPYFLNDQSTMREYGLTDMDIEWHRRRRGDKLKAVRADLALPGPLVPDPLPPEEEVLEMILSLANDDKKEYVLSLPNRNLIANLPEYAVVEVPVRLGAGITQLPPVVMPLELTPPLLASAVKDELTVRAALTGDKELLFKAILACPLTKSVRQAREITAAMLEAEKDFLPIQFV